MDNTQRKRHFHQRTSTAIVILMVFVCEDALSSAGASRAEANFNRSCYSLASQNAVDFFIQPAPHTYRAGTFFYDKDQNVTLTCKLKDVTGVEGPGIAKSTPLVFIQSCFSGGTGSSCQGWMSSVPEAGRSELTLSRSSSASSRPYGCQFTCWLIAPACSGAAASDVMVPGLGHCQLGALSGVFFTVQFGDKPYLNSWQCVSRNWLDLECTWAFQEITPGNSTVYRVSYQCCGEQWNATQDEIKVTVDGKQLRITIVVSENFVSDVLYVFTVVIDTSYGLVIVNNNVSTNVQIVKLSPAINVTVTSDDANSTLLTVTWQLSDDFVSFLGELSNCVLECAVRVTAMDTWVPVHTVTTDCAPRADCTSDRGVKVRGLRPFTNYSATVQFRAPGGQYWSDLVGSSGSTSEDGCTSDVEEWDHHRIQGFFASSDRRSHVAGSDVNR